jgi:hypothetical protein
MLIFHKTLRYKPELSKFLYQYFYISGVQDDKLQVFCKNLDVVLSNIIFPVTYSLTSPSSGVYGRSGAVGKRIFRCGSWTSFISRNLSHSHAPSPVSPAIDHNIGLLFKLLFSQLASFHGDFIGYDSDNVNQFYISLHWRVYSLLWTGIMDDLESPTFTIHFINVLFSHYLLHLSCTSMWPF